VQSLAPVPIETWTVVLVLPSEKATLSGVVGGTVCGLVAGVSVPAVRRIVPVFPLTVAVSAPLPDAAK
jgi:hypothetical protein